MIVDFPELFAPRRMLTFLLRLIDPVTAKDFILLNSRLDTHIPFTRYYFTQEYTSHQKHYTVLTAFVHKSRNLGKEVIDYGEKTNLYIPHSPTPIDAFRRQVELVDWTGEKDMEVLRERIGSLAARTPGRFALRWDGDDVAKPQDGERARFIPIRPGGQRDPLIYDPKGYFVITIDRAAGQIVLRHYLPDHTPAHEMRGRSAESMYLGLLREGLVSQLSHAGYLGGELAKAESALRLGVGVRYEQDRPLRRDTPPPTESAKAGTPAMPAVGVSLTREQLLTSQVGETVDVVMEVTAQPSERVLEGTLAEPGQDDPLRSFRRTDHTLRIRWSPDTQVVMGNPNHFSPGALLRVHGALRSENEMDAQLIAVLTRVADVA